MIFDDLDLFFVQGSCFFGGEFKEPVQPTCKVLAVHLMFPFVVFSVTVMESTQRCRMGLALLLFCVLG